MRSPGSIPPLEDLMFYVVFTVVYALALVLGLRGIWLLLLSLGFFVALSVVTFRRLDRGQSSLDWWRALRLPRLEWKKLDDTPDWWRGAADRLGLEVEQKAKPILHFMSGRLGTNRVEVQRSGTRRARALSVKVCTANPFAGIRLEQASPPPRVAASGKTTAQATPGSIELSPSRARQSWRKLCSASQCGERYSIPRTRMT